MTSIKVIECETIMRHHDITHIELVSIKFEGDECLKWSHWRVYQDAEYLFGVAWEELYGNEPIWVGEAVTTEAACQRLWSLHQLCDKSNIMPDEAIEILEKNGWKANE